MIKIQCFEPQLNAKGIYTWNDQQLLDVLFYQTIIYMNYLLLKKMGRALEKYGVKTLLENSKQNDGKFITLLIIPTK